MDKPQILRRLLSRVSERALAILFRIDCYSFVPRFHCRPRSEVRASTFDNPTKRTSAGIITGSDEQTLGQP
jgi:hypothetical protein